MTLTEAIKSIIDAKGLTILKSPMAINILSDYNAFSEHPSSKSTLKNFIGAKNIYGGDHEYQADVKVFVVDAENKADLVVFKIDKEYIRPRRRKTEGFSISQTKHIVQTKKYSL